MEFQPFDTDNENELRDAFKQMQRVKTYLTNQYIMPPVAFVDRVCLTLTRLIDLVTENIGEDNPVFLGSDKEYPGQIVSETRNMLEVTKRILYHIPKPDQPRFDHELVKVNRCIKKYLKILAWMMHNQTRKG